MPRQPRRAGATGSTATPDTRNAGARRWRRFYAGQAIGLALAAVGLAWLFHATRLDLRLEAPYYAGADLGFPWRHAWLTETAIHHDLARLLAGLGLAVWAVALGTRWRQARGHPPPRWLAGRTRRWWVLALAFALAPAASALWRHFSAMPCPWDVAGLGGTTAYFDLLQPVPAGAAQGRCFPAGFVTVGTWLLALALLWYPERPRRSVLLGLLLGGFALALGWVQQLRGAHFLSHTLWAVWLSWAVVVALHAACGAWREGSRGTTGTSATHRRRPYTGDRTAVCRRS